MRYDDTELINYINKFGIDEIDINRMKENGIEEFQARMEQEIDFILFEMGNEQLYNEVKCYLLEKTESCTNVLLKARYLTVATLLTIKNEKLINAKAMIQYCLEHRDEIFENGKWTHSALNILKVILLVSSTMDIQPVDIAELTIEYIESNKCICNVIERLTPLINKLKEPDKSKYKERLQIVYLRIIKGLEEQSLSQILTAIEATRNCFLDTKPLKKAIVESSLKIVQNGERGIKELCLIKAALKYAKSIDEKELEDECLKTISDIATNNTIDWQHIEIPYEQSHIEQIKSRIHYTELFLKDESYSVGEKIRMISKLLNIEVLDEYKKPKGVVNVYISIPSYTAANDFSKAFSDGNVISQLCTSMTLGDGKIIDTENNPISNGRDYLYQNHFVTDILPAMSSLESVDEFTVGSLLQYVIKGKNILSENHAFLKAAFEMYELNNNIAFVHIIVPCIEGILRNIYTGLRGVDIKSKDKNPETQTTVNLSDMFKDPAFKNGIGEDTYEYLSYVLNDEKGENIRNNVAHHLKPDLYFNRRCSMILMHLVIYLCDMELQTDLE